MNYPQQPTDASGFFTVPVDSLADGTYNWRVKGPHGAANTITTTLAFLAMTGTVTLTNTGNDITQAEMGTQKAGDCNGDNTVSLGDFNILKNTFGKLRTMPGFDGRADLNVDDVVSLVDFNLLKTNFGWSGAGAIRPSDGPEGGQGAGLPNPGANAGANTNANADASSGQSGDANTDARAEPSSGRIPLSTPVPASVLALDHGKTASNGNRLRGPNSLNTTSTVIYLHADQLGSVSVATDANGAVVSEQSFDPWGKVRSVGSTGDVTQTKLNYTGHKLDDTGLLFYNARYYDPVLGRFVSSDSNVTGSLVLAVAFPKQAGNSNGPSNPQALNRYSYVLNNPLGYVDPSGHYPAPPFGGGRGLTGPNKDVGSYRAMVHSMFRTLSGALSDPMFDALQGLPVNAGFGLGNWALKNSKGGDWEAGKGIRDLYGSGDKQLYFNAGGRTDIASELFGNILFGYLGAGVGYSKDVLGAQGDVFNTATDLKGVNGADSDAVAFGMHLWTQYGRDISEEDLAKEIEEYIRTHCVHTRRSVGKCLDAQKQLQQIVSQRGKPDSGTVAGITAGMSACNGEAP